MSIQTRCPGCGVVLTLEPHLLGRKMRCGKCGERFLVREPGTSGASDPAPVATKAGLQPEAPAVPGSGAEPALAVPLRRKKKRRRPAPALSLRLWIVLGSVAAFLLLVGGSVALGLLLLAWHRSPPNLVGTWKGSVQIRDDVSKAAQGQNAPPVVGNILGGFAQLATDEMLAVTVDFKQSGTAFYSGNTAGMGIEGQGDGPWEIVQADRDVLIVRMGPANAPFEARLAFRDRDSFSFTRPDKPDQAPIMFTRVRN